MPRITLRIYVNPGEAEIFCSLLRKDGLQEQLIATVDTGAEVSLFPEELMDLVEYRLSPKGKIIVNQAGIAQQVFEVTEAYVTMTLEDAHGNMTSPFEVLVWFTNTSTRLIGFADVLERGVLHIDMPQRTGWFELTA